MIGIGILVGSIVATVFATTQAKRAWGTGAAVGTGVAGGLGVLLLPIAGLILMAVIFAMARNAYLRKVAEGDDEGRPADDRYGHADPNNPYSPPGFGPEQPADPPE